MTQKTNKHMHNVQRVKVAVRKVPIEMTALFWALITALLILLSLSGCTSNSGTSTPSDPTFALTDDAADFSAYDSFALVTPPEEETPPEEYTEAVRIALINSLTDELEGVGLTEADTPEEADLLVTAFIREQTIDSTVTGYWYEAYWGWYWGYYETWYENDEVQFDVGTLIVDVVDTMDKADPDDDRLVMRGTSTGVLSDSPVDAPARVVDAVEEIFALWPVE